MVLVMSLVGRSSMNNLLKTLGIIIACEKANGACNAPCGKISHEQFAQALGIIIAFGIIIACEKANSTCNAPSGKIEYEQFAQPLQRNEAMRLCGKANATCNAPCGKFEYEQFLKL